jgi:hypothetical protein
MSKKAYLAPSIATNQVCLVGFSPTVDPDGRGTWDYVYEGTSAGIASVAAIMSAAGARINASYDSGTSKLSASFPFYPGADPSDTGALPTAEVPTDRYSIRFGAAQVSLFALPKATNEAAAAPGISTIAEYKKIITDHVNDGTAITDRFDIAVTPFAFVIYRLLSHGIESINVDRPTLRRHRTYSYAYAERRTITFNQYVYTTSRLLTTFSIPADVASILPVDPSGTGETPASCTWGWRISDQDLEYNPASRKFEESVVWEYAAYDTGIFTVLS